MVVFSALNGLSEDELSLAAAIIRGGRLAVVPTDTVYGIGAIAADPVAVHDILKAKGRGPQMPPPVLIPSVESMEQYVAHIPDTVYELASRFWPGALTLILPAHPDLCWDLGQTNGTLAVRIPDHRVTLDLLKATGPMAVTSANTTGQPPALNCQEAVDYFGDMVDLYIDAGQSAGGVASTILNFSTPKPQIVRLGALDVQDLNQVPGLSLLV